ncbi:TetR/AcrR family transcriptional regulator [Aliiroseovarius sp. S2029]|uniref:TetR/AcrR family transcriptional regulator n=1 Tax=Aliiroseovarius sp. S2029 TaxID=2936988 RepID=UPI0020BF3C8A|nr:TetR/AcrR family transcriptional regulator [Aliiroseovarius sp. S2029]MCK8485119.1 TetR/AcrR family transcriptional regulator [Aliiroseovarius sp. S2029]
MPEKKPRLKADDWIRAGLAALVSDGPQALKAEVLARRLNTTKGSFYWHFKDVPDFHQRLLARWEELAIAAISHALSDADDPVKRLYHLGHMAAASQQGVGQDRAETAIRAWAYGYDLASDAVLRVDQRRIELLGETLNALDLTNPDFARIIHSAIVGMSALSATDMTGNKNAMSTLMAAILALRDA